MADKPGILETANNIYFEEVENEDGMQLNLEEQMRTNLSWHHRISLCRF
jgi:hypothetical protein